MKKQKTIKNIPASIREKLFKVAKQNNVDFNFVLRQYIQERFLFRLSISRYAASFILKGAVLFMAYDISRTRPTKDIDFLGMKIPNNPEEIKQVLSEIAMIKDSDGVSFDIKEIESEKIREGAFYEGVRIHIPALLGSIKQMLILDVGFGDIIVNGPNQIAYPTILESKPPLLHAYSIGSAIAEKFEAVVSLGQATSRMKDYYDLLYFISNQSFQFGAVKDSILATFQNRKTLLDTAKNIFRDEFRNNQELQSMWLRFIVKRKLGGEANFAAVIQRLEKFFMPLLLQHNINMVWNPDIFEWQKR